MSTYAILTFLSNYNEKRLNDKKKEEHKDYIAKDKKIYKGFHTNDAPAKYLISTISKNFQKQDTLKYIYIETQKAKKNIEEGYYKGKTIEQRLKEQLNNYISKENKSNITEIDFEKIEYNENEKDQDKMTIELYNDIIKKLKNVDKVYIDFTSGFRDISFLMILITRYLKTLNIDCAEIVYANLDGNLYSLNEQYNMFDIISGVDMFSQTGSVKLLNDALQSKQKNNDVEINELLNVIGDFSEAISVNRVEDIKTIFPKLEVAIKNVENMDDSNRDAILFKSIVGIIKEKFYLDEGDSNLIKIIKWANKNYLFQQAITMYIELIPDFYDEQKIYNKKINFYLDIDCLVDAENPYKNKVTDEGDLKKIFKEYINHKVKQISKFDSKKFDLNYDENKFKKLCQNYDKFIEENYDNGKRKKEKKLGGIYIGKTIETLNKSLSEGGSKGFYELLEEQPIKHKKDFSNKKRDDKIYLKKLESLLSAKENKQLLKNSRFNEKIKNYYKNDLEVIERGYLYFIIFKYYRNHISHAAKESPGQKEFKQKIKENYNIDIEFNSGKIQQLLEEALQNNEKLLDLVKR